LLGCGQPVQFSGVSRPQRIDRPDERVALTADFAFDFINLSPQGRRFHALRVLNVTPMPFDVPAVLLNVAFLFGDVFTQLNFVTFQNVRGTLLLVGVEAVLPLDAGTKLIPGLDRRVQIQPR
jgi:hypothetical protein